MKKTQLAPQKAQLNTGANKLSKTLKQQEIRAQRAQPGYPNISERRANSRAPNTSSPPKNISQAQTTTKKKMTGADGK